MNSLVCNLSGNYSSIPRWQVQCFCPVRVQIPLQFTVLSLALESLVWHVPPIVYSKTKSSPELPSFSPWKIWADLCHGVWLKCICISRFLPSVIVMSSHGSWLLVSHDLSSAVVGLSGDVIVPFVPWNTGPVHCCAVIDNKWTLDLGELSNIRLFLCCIAADWHYWTFYNLLCIIFLKGGCERVANILK